MVNNPEFTINIPPRQPLEGKDCAALSSPRGFGWEKDSKAQMAVPQASPLLLHLRFRGDCYISLLPTVIKGSITPQRGGQAMKTFQREYSCHWETVHILLGKLGTVWVHLQQDTNVGVVLLFAHLPSDTRLRHPA